MESSGLAPIKREESYLVCGVEVTKTEYDEYNKQNPAPFSKYYELRYAEDCIIDPHAYNEAVSAIRASQTDKHDLIAAIAHEILKDEGY
jgi:hypothetical protein